MSKNLKAYLIQFPNGEISNLFYLEKSKAIERLELDEKLFECEIIINKEIK